MENYNKKNIVLTTLLIGLCFLWTSAGYLSWLYHLLDFFPSATADLLSEVVGYLFQIVGILIVAVFIKKDFTKRKFFIAALIIDYFFILAAMLAPNAITALIFGYAMNLLHGIVAGCYLLLLAFNVPQQHRGIVFGAGYAIGSIGSWLLSLIGGGHFLSNANVLIIYAAMVFATIIVCFEYPQKEYAYEITSFENRLNCNYSLSLVLLVDVTVLLLSLVKNVGFYFPMADLSDGSFTLEFTRIFYGIGLIIAGLINDKNRKYGAISCVAALIFPFILLFLQQSTSSSEIFWIIGYLFFGFFTVYRVVIFTDLAGKSASFVYMAGFGLMFGRLGDVLGSLLGMKLVAQPLILISISSILFVGTIFLFFAAFQRLYMNAPQVIPESSSSTKLEQDLNNFYKSYDFSNREIEVIKLLLSGMTNPEIADALYISENTVKFHVRNILKKTDCANRKELLKKIPQ